MQKYITLYYVKRTLVLFLLLQVFTANTFAVEIMRLPFLVEHYLEHEKEQKGDLSFASFLLEHYVEGDHLEEDHCDKKLPFKHCHDGYSPASFSADYAPAEWAIDTGFSVNPAEFYFSLKQGCSSCYCGSIWQPPKIG